MELFSLSRVHIDSTESSAEPFGVAWRPATLRWALVLAMFLPGSFAVLPLIWLWHRWNGGRTL